MSTGGEPSWEEKFTTLKEEYEEFQQSSKEYEGELEKEVENLSSSQSKLNATVENLTAQLEDSRAKLDAQSSAHAKEVRLASSSVVSTCDDVAHRSRTHPVSLGR